MLTDPLPIKRPALTATTTVSISNTASFPRVNAGDGSARYEIATLPLVTTGTDATNVAPATLKISHTVSNENKPVKTSRTLIRLDCPVSGPNGEVLNSFVYAVIGVPYGILKNGIDDPLTRAELGRGLVEFLVGVLSMSSTAAEFDELKIDRILAGES